MIKQELEQRIKKALERAHNEINLGIEEIQELEIQITRPKDKKFGDFSTNIAMIIASRLKSNPRQIATMLVDGLTESGKPIDKVEIAGPGFLNLYLDSSYLYEAINLAIDEQENFGRAKEQKNIKVQVEFVSANPVGPMHVGHGRWAAVGDTLARLLDAAGYEVYKEFYINDYGNQMRLFGESLSARARELMGAPFEFPENGYMGAYIKEIAQEIVDKEGDKFLELGDDEITFFIAAGYRIVLKKLRHTLETFGVSFDVWFSERALHETNDVNITIDKLRQKGFVYDQDGAVWLRTMEHGDDKDRVLIKADGSFTYFAADIAYHANKLARGFSKIINIWGADHHGYVPRMKAAVIELGGNKDTLEVIIGQLVNLTREGQPVRMSKRTGEMVTFDELIDEVGTDAARYFFISRSTDTALDFDIDLAKRQSSENPVFYVQYAHARICSILRTATERDIDLSDISDIDYSLLNTEYEKDLISQIYQLPEIIERIAEERSIHLITAYAYRLGEKFHAFYKNCRIIGVDKDLMKARAALLKAAQITLRNTLGLMGVSAPEQM